MRMEILKLKLCKSSGILSQAFKLQLVRVFSPCLIHKLGVNCFPQVKNKFIKDCLVYITSAASKRS